jgi:hypothetical protein
MEAQSIPSADRPAAAGDLAVVSGGTGGMPRVVRSASVHPADRAAAVAAVAAPGEPAAVRRLRLAVLEALHGPEPRSAYAVPCRWPMIRVHVLAAIRRLCAEGLLERVPGIEPGGGDAGYRATAAGRATLAGSVTARSPRGW